MPDSMPRKPIDLCPKACSFFTLNHAPWCQLKKHIWFKCQWGHLQTVFLEQASLHIWISTTLKRKRSLIQYLFTIYYFFPSSNICLMLFFFLSFSIGLTWNWKLQQATPDTHMKNYIGDIHIRTVILDKLCVPITI